MSDPKTVLIVEDEKNIVDILRFNLQRAGYQTLEAYDGEDGLAQAVSANPDLILLDVMLPKKNGFDVCRQLREAGKLSDITYGLMDNKLDELAHVLGGCERLATTPVPFAYTLILQRTVYLFCTLLPFALVGDLHYMTPFVSALISYTFISLDTLAEELEDPFGTEDNDLPLDAICNMMERDLLQMNDEENIPERLMPDKYYQLT